MEEVDKSWMTLRHRVGERYREGAKSFVDRAMAKVSQNGTIQCPCNNCTVIVIWTLPML